jgi:tetratricopeptide (TPR) repeat protein
VVLDFGIAKPLAGAFAEPFPATGGWPVGTPAYMAPEQTRPGAIDTRADVYALGALLYELVAGRAPLEPSDDLVVTFERLRDVVPEPPSEAAAAAGRPWSAPRAFLRDLDAIALKALEKAPERRYPTVSAWRADLEHALASEPIEARAPTWTYRTLCFARRERALVGALALVFGGLCVGVVGLALGLREAGRQRAVALVQREAQMEINRFLTDDLLEQASPELLGGGVPVRELVARASEGVDERFAERPLVAAAIHHTLGNVSAELGEFDRAESHLERSLELRRQAAGPDAPETVHCEVAVASLLARRQLFEQAERAMRAALARAEPILGPDDPVLWVAWNDLGVTLDGLGRHPEAIEAYERALEGRRRVLGPTDMATFATLNNLALAHDQLGDSERTLALLEHALALARAMPSVAPITLLGLENNIGATLQDLERNAAAEPHLAAAAEHARKALGEDHPATLTIRSNLAGLMADNGRPLEAMEQYADVAERQARVLGPDAYDTLNSRHGLWSSAWKAGLNEQAAGGFEELLADAERALGDHWLTAQTQASLAHALADGGHAEQALPHARAAALALTASYGADHPRTRNAAALTAELEERTPGGP